MNMLLHGVKDTEFEIFHGDTLLNEWDMMREENPPRSRASTPSSPTCRFSYRWDPTDALAEDVRFKATASPPSPPPTLPSCCTASTYLKDEGVMAIILPHGVLFRAGGGTHPHQAAEGRAHRHRHRLARQPFYSTGIPVCILVLKKCKKPDDVLFINAAEHFDKGKRQNLLKPSTSARSSGPTSSAKRKRATHAGWRWLRSRRTGSTSTSRAASARQWVRREIDLVATHRELVAIEQAIAAAKDKHNGFLKELGLPLPDLEPESP